MSNHKKHKSASKGKNKTFASKRTANPTHTHHGQEVLNSTAAFEHHDSLRRLGSFETKGEHARTGNRGHQ